ncbi:hypothetical protein FFLO_03548 [Filobasidium floriforme]|uniref:Uncharacterized protein n=1 Tax=Filobasidium floriforme TaxID=5210 RepID=A0A8K0JKV9_9TREE|nr:uncharacterized protein HD553DRAFT_220480 [Filobasidium floriforme]KAG7535950.1 hypothetical protein FFLO_03548 [Filobasidium floriforme]KAH8086555.1 hypothetical protein HD553DRAFT_220480 [Filobasidium floriforme]
MSPSQTPHPGRTIFPGIPSTGHIVAGPSSSTATAPVPSASPYQNAYQQQLQQQQQQAHHQHQQPHPHQYLSYLQVPVQGPGPPRAADHNHVESGRPGLPLTRPSSSSNPSSIPPSSSLSLPILNTAFTNPHASSSTANNHADPSTSSHLTSATKAVKLALFESTSRPGESRCTLCEEYTSTAKEGILMYHVMGKKDHVKSRHAMCKRYDDWGEDPYWEDVYGRIAGFVAGKPGAEGLMAKVIESYPQLSFASRMLYQGRWWETLELDHPILKFWSDRQLADFRPKSDAEALEIGVKKFDAMAQLFYGDLEPPIRFHINSYARGLLILAIGPESVMQLELNSPSSQRPGNVLRLWMNWVLREMLYLFVAQFIEADTPGYPTPFEWAQAYVKQHMIYLCSLSQPHMRHMTTDYCRWLIWCTNNLYGPAKRPMIFRSLESIYRAYEDAYFVYERELSGSASPTQEHRDRFEFADIIVATMSHEFQSPRRTR